MGTVFADCTDFKPSVTNEGLCFTRNSGNFHKIFKPSQYVDEFKEIMLSGGENDSVKHNKGSGIQYQYTFIVDANRYNDLRRGNIWNKETDTNLHLGVHSPNDIADIRGSGIAIHSGYETTIRIDLKELYSDPSIRSIAPNRRQCMFDDENEEMTIFKWYSRTNCLLDCRTSLVEKECGCRPWDYPFDSTTNVNIQNQTRICDYFGNTCFNALMKTAFGEKQCLKECLPDCNSVKYTISVEKTPFSPDKKICHYSKEKDHNNRGKDLGESIRNHVFGRSQTDPKWLKSTPIRTVTRLVQDSLKHLNKSSTEETICTEKVMADIAVVHVIVNNPTVLRLIQTNRVSFTDKLANFGKYIYK